MLNMISFNKLSHFIKGKLSHFAVSTIIRGVEKEYDGYVYNLSIEDDETYIADGFAVHNCRSTIIPTVKPEFEIKGLKGKRPEDGDDGKGKISPDVTYGDWLKRQSSDFQVEVLGPSRAKLFTSGALEIERFRDETGIVYSLERLEQLEPMAFQRAGVRVDGQRLVKRE
jgi:hypothetical protein